MIVAAVTNVETLEIGVANSGIVLFRACIEDARWELMELRRGNQPGTFCVAQDGANVMKEQKIGGALLFT